MKFSLIDDGQRQNVTVLHNGEMYVADDAHPNFDMIIDAVLNGESENIDELFDVGKAVAKRFDRLSERVTVANGTIFFDGEAVDNALTRAVVRFLNAGVNDFKPLVNFFENVMNNPQEHSREQLYSWLADRDFTITSDGCFLAYKGVRKDGNTYKSINSGSAIVDGVAHNGNIPNKVGSVVEMPRGSVESDSGVGCARGLHAGTWSYASTFGRGHVLLVKINPRDVISVPTDCGAQKLRVCRYNVERALQAELDSVLYNEEDEETCLDCGEDLYDCHCDCGCDLAYV